MTEAEMREAARKEYIAPGSKITLKQLAEKYGVPYYKVAKWKREDDWDSQMTRRRRGTYYGNQTSVKDGAYSTIKLEDLPESEREIVLKTPVTCKAVLEDEIRILKYRERKILEKLEMYAQIDDSPNSAETYLSTETITRSTDSDSVTHGKETSYMRWLKLNEALDRVHGKIIKLTSTLLVMEETERKRRIEEKRLRIQELKITGQIDVDIDIDEDET